MKYDPKDASSAIPAGVYEATVTAVSEVDKDGRALQDKNGYDMCKVLFDIYVGDVTRKLTQYFSASPSALWRMKKMAEAVGLGDKFRAQQLQPSEFVNRNLRLTLTVKDDPTYGEQNQISAYEPTTLAARPAQARPSLVQRVVESRKPAAIEDDSIPF